VDLYQGCSSQRFEAHPIEQYSRKQTSVSLTLSYYELYPRTDHFFDRSTSSRDTQEVPYDAGLEVLRIIATYQSRASLLQDFAWYEAQHRLDKSNEEAGGGSVTGDSAIPPRQAHYARNDRNQPQQPPSNSGTPPPPPPSSSNTNQQQSQNYIAHERQHSQNSQAYPQFIPPTPPYAQLPSHGFSPSPPPHPHQAQQNQQRQPFRSFWSRGGNGNSPQQYPNGGPQNQQQNYSMNNGQYDGSGLAF